MAGEFAPEAQGGEIERRMGIAGERRHEVGEVRVIEGVSLIDPEALLGDMGAAGKRRQKQYEGDN